MIRTRDFTYDTVLVVEVCLGENSFVGCMNMNGTSALSASGMDGENLIMGIVWPKQKVGKI